MDLTSWEYRLERFPTYLLDRDDLDRPERYAKLLARDMEIQKILNDIGSEGWELVSTSVVTHRTDYSSRNGDNLIFVFKRRRT